MNYYPNIEKVKSISDIIQFDNSNSKVKIEYLIFNYLREDYKVFDNTKDYWITASMITNNLLNKNFIKLIKKQSSNFIYSKIDEVIVSVLLQRSTETPKKRQAIDTINPDLIDDEVYREVEI
jgi:hypothetical protein